MDGTRDTAPRNISWSSYATQYDLMCDVNPAYVDNMALVLDGLSDWSSRSDLRICDLGAGTGNYICALSRVFNTAQFVHVDLDPNMNAYAKRKYDTTDVDVELHSEDMHNVRFDSESFDLIVCANSLFCAPPQDRILKKIATWLRPGGRLVLVDFGRRQQTLDWLRYVGRVTRQRTGPVSFIRSLYSVREVLRQNRNARKDQISGGFWLHSTDEFQAILNQIGFHIRDIGQCYRGFADFAICELPQRSTRPGGNSSVNLA